MILESSPPDAPFFRAKNCPPLLACNKKERQSLPLERKLSEGVILILNFECGMPNCFSSISSSDFSLGKTDCRFLVILSAVSFNFSVFSFNEIFRAFRRAS